MDRQRIFITGASGCIGQYIVEVLVQQTQHELFLLVRNPDKLQVDCSIRPNIHVLQGDLQRIDEFADVLGTIDTAILTAAAWGDPAITFDINVTKTLALMELLNVDRCQQVIYFSTASLLGQNNQPLEEAGIIGTDYIRTKYICHQRLSDLAIAPKITTVYPTLVFGGDGTKPYSHLSGGLADVMKWVWLIRFFQVDGSFHFSHAQDIAQVIAQLVEHPPESGRSRDCVLGNPAITANEMIQQLCIYFQKRIYFQVPLLPIADVIIKLFRIQMAEWDRFCMDYRHFSYQNPLSPASFDQPVYCETITDLMKVHQITP
ncbi:MAG: NAD(P)-dependent oxidoreductase [Cyanobacteria bacterium P01_E01_bin.6]